MADTPPGGTATTDEVEHPEPAAGGRGSRRGPLARGTRFGREVAAEMRKVIWPTRSELVTYTSVVLVFVTIMVGLVFVMDYVFGQGVLAVFG
jgi:preprotein translocase subunit SecE